MGRYENTIVVNYRLTKKLGEGGFGTVFLAEHTELGRKAACKILHREFAEQPDVVERFFREAKAVCAIGHKAIIEIENFGKLPDGEPYYLMEFFPGESLMDRAKRRPLSPAEAIAVFGPVASALAAAHAKQIIHRDLKPENIMLLEEEGLISDVKLLDFGIAKLVHEADAVRSRSNVAMGTPSYMPPEQARDAKGVDQRSDIYSFAATMYAAFAARPPFSAGSIAGVLVKVQMEPPDPLRQYAPSIPAAVQTVIEKCMHKDPAQRPATITEAWRELKTALVAARSSANQDAALAQTIAPANLPAPVSHSALVAPTLAPDAPTNPARVSTHGHHTTLGSAAAQSVAPDAPVRRRWLVPVIGVVIVGGGVAAFVATRSPGSKTEIVATNPDARSMAATPDAEAVETPDATLPAASPDASVARAPEDAPVAILDAKPTPVPPKPERPVQLAVALPRVSGEFPALPGGPKTVNARLCIDSSGNVVTATLLDPIDRSLAKVAVAALRRMRYTPYRGDRASAGACFSQPFANPANVISSVVVVAPGSAAPPPPPPPSGPDCSVGQFDRICDASKPSDAEVNAAIKRLGECRSRLKPEKYTNLTRCLIAK